MQSIFETASLVTTTSTSMDVKSVKELGFPEYWNRRYENALESEGATYEWFRSFEKLRPFLERELPHHSSEPRMLHLGCGDSVRLPSHFLSTFPLVSAPQEVKLNLMSYQDVTYRSFQTPLRQPAICRLFGNGH